MYVPFTEANLKPYQTSMMELLCDNHYQLKAVKNFCENAPS